MEFSIDKIDNAVYYVAEKHKYQLLKLSDVFNKVLEIVPDLKKMDSKQELFMKGFFSSMHTYENLYHFTSAQGGTLFVLWHDKKENSEISIETLNMFKQKFATEKQDVDVNMTYQKDVLKLLDNLSDKSDRLLSDMELVSDKLKNKTNVNSSVSGYLNLSLYLMSSFLTGYVFSKFY